MDVGFAESGIVFDDKVVVELMHLYLENSGVVLLRMPLSILVLVVGLVIYCTITAGANIGTKALGVKPVVSSVESDSLYAGSPAKYIKEV